MPVECMVDPQSDLCKAALYKPHIVMREQWGARDPSDIVCSYDWHAGGEFCWHDSQNEGFYDPVENLTGYACYSELVDLEQGIDTRGQTLAEVYNTIVIHHSGNTNDETIQDVQNLHMDENHWADIGYHFVISKDGTIYEGRDIGVRGHHVESANSYKIGILVIGDFEPGDYWDSPFGEVQISDEAGDVPTSAQISSLRSLIIYLDTLYGIDRVGGHNEFNITRCPGKNMEETVRQMKSLVRGGS